MRRAARVDANHGEIVKALRACGCTVLDASGLGGGFPDLVVGCQGRTVLMEVKDGSKVPSARKLTDAQVQMHAAWNGGPLVVVCDVKSAMQAISL